MVPVCAEPSCQVAPARQLCEGCHIKLYCSAACQKKHWYSEHVRTCADTRSSDVVTCAEASCRKPGNFICAFCELVSYCSSTCQRKDWFPRHRDECRDAEYHTHVWNPQWRRDQRQPHVLTSGDYTISPQTLLPPVTYRENNKYKPFWGSTPAIDVINIQQNEWTHDDDHKRVLHILFPASSDIRTPIRSTIDLPSTFESQCTMVLTGEDIDLAFRNFILLWIALRVSTDAPQIMIQIWYNTFITPRLAQLLREGLVPEIQEQIFDNQVHVPEEEAESVRREYLGSGSASHVALRACFTVREWRRLQAVLRCEHIPTLEKAQLMQKRYRMGNPDDDFLDLHLCLRFPGWRKPTLIFRSSGLLQSFQDRRDLATVPNPLLFFDHGRWCLDAGADPLNSWDLSKILPYMRIRNDIYGALYRYLVDIFRRFCRRMVGSPGVLKFLVMPCGIRQGRLENSIGGLALGQTFDRIDGPPAININGELAAMHTPHLSAITIDISPFKLLLKSSRENPSATLIMMRKDDLDELCYLQDSKADMAKLIQDNRWVLPSPLTIIQHFRLLPYNDPWHPEWIRFTAALHIARDWQKLFAFWAEVVEFGGHIDNTWVMTENTILSFCPRDIQDMKSGGALGVDLAVQSTYSTLRFYMELQRRE